MRLLQDGYLVLAKRFDVGNFIINYVLFPKAKRAFGRSQNILILSFTEGKTFCFNRGLRVQSDQSFRFVVEIQLGAGHIHFLFESD